MLGVLSFCVSTLVAAECLSVQGQVQTQSINDEVQVGNLTMVPASGSVPKFRATFGQLLLAGGIRGEIVETSWQTAVNATIYLKHEVGFPGVGVFTTDRDLAEVTFDFANSIATVRKEVLNVVGGGMFSGWTGQLVANGTLELQTGVNTFSYSGQICKPSQ